MGNHNSKIAGRCRRRVSSTSPLGSASAWTPRMELVDDLLRDAAPVGDLLAGLLGPIADRLVLFPVRRSTAPSPSGPAAHHDAPARYPGTSAHVRREDVPQFRRVLVGEVDLVLNTVESELDSLVGVASVEVVHQLVNDLLSHAPLSSRTRVIGHIQRNNNAWPAPSVNGAPRFIAGDPYSATQRCGSTPAVPTGRGSFPECRVR